MRGCQPADAGAADNAGVDVGYHVRPARRDDLPAIVEIVRAADVVDAGLSDFVMAVLLEDWRRPRFDPAVDSWVAVAPDDQPVGYAEVYDELPHEAVEAVARVHPDHRGRGIGARFLSLMEARAREHLADAGGASVRLQPVVSSGDTAARALVEREGYIAVRRFWHMVIRPKDAQVPRLPDGIRVHPFEPERDARAVHALLQEAFAGHWNSLPEAFGDWAEATLESELFDPGLWFVAFRGDDVVGVVWGHALGDRGWVSELGVAPSARGRGIGGALLLTAFDVFAHRGFGEVLLNVDAGNETGATSLYERVGMRIRRRWHVYEKELR